MNVGLVLAAGPGRRLGGVKPLLLTETVTLIQASLHAFRESELDQIVLVLGYEAKSILQKINFNGIKVVINNRYRMGRSTSLQRGLDYLPDGTDTITIGLGDMPLITAETINRLIAAYARSKKSIVVPTHKKQRGYPVIVDIKHRDDLMHLSGDVGVDVLIQSRDDDVHEVRIASEEVVRDIDTYQDFIAVRELIAEFEPPQPLYE